MKAIKKYSVILGVIMAITSLTGCKGGGASSSTGNSGEENQPPVQSVEKVIDLAGQTSMDKTVEKANQLANGVQAYFTDGDRDKYVVENSHVQLEHTLVDSIFVSSLKNKSGEEYLFNTMDAYVVKAGDYYYAKQSPTDARVNTVRLGYYYYEANVRDITFDPSIPLYLDKTYHTYTDKMHQEFSLVAGSSTKGVDTFGFEIKLRAETVAAIEIKDGAKTHSDVSGAIDANSVEYVGVDIKNVGIMGIVIPDDDSSVTVTKDAKYYVIRQELPMSGIAFAKADEVSFGNRLYTDETHSFEGLRTVNTEEKSPLTDANITVDENVDGAEFVGYDPLKGSYKFNLDGMGFNTAYFYTPQKKFYEHIQIKDVKDNRTVYLWVHTEYPLEGACLLDENNMQLPIPMQVSKNFGHEKEEPIYDPQDLIYGDTYVPIQLEKDEDKSFTIVNVMKAWGNFDIKQLSSISYYVSYYHLSTGVTESTCIAPYYTAGANWEIDGWILPDFRGCSESFWGDEENKTGDPQYGSVGKVFGPLNENGMVTSVYEGSDIASAGLTNADITISYLSSDGKYRYDIRQVEMPQNDETRVYYTISMTFLEDTEIDNSAFSLIGFDGRSVTYAKSAYLDENGVEQEVTNPKTLGNQKIYKLHKNGSYFAYYDINESVENTGEDIMDARKDVGNFGVIVKNQEITVNGESSDVGLAFLNDFKGTLNYGSLTLDSDVSFKAGDTISVDLVLLPFGIAGQSHCDNVRNVYNDTVVNEIKTTATVGEVVQDTWLPTVKAENNIAEFTVTGGVSENTQEVNYTVKIEGCTVLGTPKIQEYVNGEWVDYQYSTEIGFDGYAVACENETLTYSFVFRAKDEGRKFRFTLES